MTVTEQIDYDYCDDEAVDVVSTPAGPPNVLFGSLQSGLQPSGVVLEDLCWSSFHITDHTGIEPLVGIVGFDSADAYKNYLEHAFGVPLADWEACQVELYRCWYPPLEYGSDNTEPEFCYSAWRILPDRYAIKVTPVTVYALRHKAWAKVTNGSFKAFYCARQRSYAEATWAKVHPGEELTPQIMVGFSDIGFCLSGIRPGKREREHLTWPTPDLVGTFADANIFAAQGVTDIHLWEGGVGFSLDELGPEHSQILLNAFAYHGEEMSLIDLAAVVGLC